VTVVQPTESGGVAIVTTKTDEEKTVPRQIDRSQAANQPVEDSEPVVRKARVITLPAIYAKDSRLKFERELYEELGLSDPSVVENPGFTGHLINALVNCRKFDVLERGTLQDVVKEVDFGESDYADIGKCVRIGQMLNADYVVIPEIRYIVISKKSKKIPYIPDRSRVKHIGTLATGIRVVDVRTSRIVSSSIDEATYEAKQPRHEEDMVRQAIGFISDLYGATAARLVSGIIDAVYPIKIISIDGNLVTLNRGKGAIEVGEMLKVFRSGEMLIDPDTKENLGYNEMEVGKIKVNRVLPKMAMAEVVETSSDIKKFYVCRRSEEIKTSIKPSLPPRLD